MTESQRLSFEGNTSQLWKRYTVDTIERIEKPKDFMYTVFELPFADKTDTPVQNILYIGNFQTL